MKTAIQLVERGLVPTPLVRHGIRRLLRSRLEEQEAIFAPNRDQALDAWTQEMRQAPIALVPDAANEQHYEIPGAFYELVLGKRLKYSSGYYRDANTTLDEAEENMLALTCRRAGLENGQDILELGCGWGSLTLFMAEHLPKSRILAVSNSSSQRAFIEARARERGLSNIEIRTCDMNAFEAPEKVDRIVSVEMFEHMRNWEELLGRAAAWLKPDGQIFLHVFAHKVYAYPFEAKDETDWMSRMFFTGGMMPCHDLCDALDVPFETVERWAVSGTHYARTSEDWLANLDKRKSEVMPILAETYGAADAERWFHRWRVFFLACAELFGYADGNEWIVSHQLLRPSGTSA